MSFVEFRSLSHVYHAGQANEVVALQDIDLTIEKGEFVAILGANGSGKSTLAKHINGLLLPTSGDCLVAGMNTKSAEDIWQIRQQAGMVFQNPDNQIIAAIVEDDVAFGPENLGVPPAEIAKRVTEALQVVHMQEFRSYEPHLLSGGQKQRVAIAGALAMHPQCLILDEATAMLDPQGREEVMNVVRELHDKQGITVILITHFMEEAVAADRVVIMDKGQIVREGTPRELFTHVAAMQKLGLDVPLGAYLASKLRGKGVKLPADILTAEEFAEAWEKLCRLH